MIENEAKKISRFETIDEMVDFLDTLSTFNIRARYDDYKLEFYKICTKKFSRKWINKIIGFRQWIKKQHLK